MSASASKNYIWLCKKEKRAKEKNIGKEKERTHSDILREYPYPGASSTLRMGKGWNLREGRKKKLVEKSVDHERNKQELRNLSGRKSLDFHTQTLRDTRHESYNLHIKNWKKSLDFHAQTQSNDIFVKSHQ